MKAYKLEILVIDFEDHGKECFLAELENNIYYNFQVKDIRETDIGDWYEEHPLNKRVTLDKAYKELIWT